MTRFSSSIVLVAAPCAAALCVLFAPSVARADGDAPPVESPVSSAKPPASFGAPGTVAISSDVGLGGDVQWSSNDTRGPFWSIALAPAADFFVAKGLSVGGQLLYAHAGAPDAKLDVYGVGPRIGYAFRIEPKLAFWPRAGVRFAHQVATSSGTASSANLLELDAYAPLVYSPVPHFYVGLGPKLTRTLLYDVDGGSAGTLTRLGVAFTVGGWL